MKFGINIITVILCILCVQAGFCYGGELPAVDRLLPAETLAAAWTNDYAAMDGRFRKTDIYRFYKDPAMAGFVESVKEKFNESLKDDQEFQRFISSDFPSPAGRAAIAAVMRPAPADGRTPEPATLLICQWGKEAVKAGELIEKQMKQLEEKGGKRNKEDYRGKQLISVYEPSKDRNKKETGQPEPDYYYCFIDDCFVSSDWKEAVQFVIAHAAGAGGSTLAESSDYQAAMKRAGGGDIEAYFNARKLVDMMIREDAESEKFLKAVGFDKVSGVAIGVRVGSDSGTPLSMKGCIHTDGKQGIMRILDMPAAPLKVPDFIAGESCSFTFANIDTASIYDEIFRIANSIDPRAAAAMASPLTAPMPDGRSGVKLKEDVLAWLRPGLWSADVPRKTGKGDKTEILSIGAIATTDKMKLEQSLSRMHEQYFGADKALRREFLGHTIYMISFFSEPYDTMEGPQEDAASDEQIAAIEEPTAAFAVTDSHLIFGDLQLVEDAIRAMKDKTASRLPATKWYRKAAAAMPSPAAMSSMMDLSVYGRYLWEALKTEDANTTMEFIAEEFRDHADFSKLPDFAAMKKYFGIVVTQFVSQPDGFVFEYRMLSPVEE